MNHSKDWWKCFSSTKSQHLSKKNSCNINLVDLTFQHFNSSLWSPYYHECWNLCSRLNIWNYTTQIDLSDFKSIHASDNLLNCLESFSWLMHNMQGNARVFAIFPIHHLASLGTWRVTFLVSSQFDILNFGKFSKDKIQKKVFHEMSLNLCKTRNLV